MEKVKACTWEGYENSKVSFREVQRNKPRYYYNYITDEDGECHEYLTRRKMTNTRAGLQKEYNTWNRSRYRSDIIYFIV